MSARWAQRVGWVLALPLLLAGTREGGGPHPAPPAADTLTAATIRDAYGVDADVQFHPRAGHLTVVPVGRPS